MSVSFAMHQHCWLLGTQCIPHRDGPFEASCWRCTMGLQGNMPADITSHQLEHSCAKLAQRATLSTTSEFCMCAAPSYLRLRPNRLAHQQSGFTQAVSDGGSRTGARSSESNRSAPEPAVPSGSSAGPDLDSTAWTSEGRPQEDARVPSTSWQGPGQTDGDRARYGYSEQSTPYEQSTSYEQRGTYEQGSGAAGGRYRDVEPGYGSSDNGYYDDYADYDPQPQQYTPLASYKPKPFRVDAVRCP
jgi:hypothetical protein